VATDFNAYRAKGQWRMERRMLCDWSLGNTDSEKRKRKAENEEEAAYILDVLRSGERVLYLLRNP
jgi:exoribonuclease II